MTVVFAESARPSDRDGRDQVTVDKLVYPKALPIVARSPLQVGSWPLPQVTVVQVLDLGGRKTCRFVTGGKL